MSQNLFNAEITAGDFNYYKSEDNIYQFFFLGYDNKINLVNNYGIYVDPLDTFKTLTLEGLRYNPFLPPDYNK